MIKKLLLSFSHFLWTKKVYIKFTHYNEAALSKIIPKFDEETLKKIILKYDGENSTSIVRFAIASLNDAQFLNDLIKRKIKPKALVGTVPTINIATRRLEQLPIAQRYITED